MSVPPKSDETSAAQSDSAETKRPVRSRLIRGGKKPLKVSTTKGSEYRETPAPAPAAEPVRAAPAPPPAEAPADQESNQGQPSPVQAFLQSRHGDGLWKAEH